ncbi:S-adenosylmethionine:tRNA ribosyltransferase-isomerase [Jatrophihabitans sp. DSM 45814]
MTATLPATHFALPESLTATEPPEHRGLSRDHVRLLVAQSGGIEHTTFDQLASYLSPGDLIVVNTSQTMAAEIDAVRQDGWPAVVHFATELDDRSWVVELRTAPSARRPILDGFAGELIRVARSVRVRLLEPYPARGASPTGRGNRLWRAQVVSRKPFSQYLAEHGRPISYGYLRRSWPLADYQTVFATHPGSAEMPSAGRPFSAELLVNLLVSGIAIAPITLHTGVSSQEAGEPPQAERFSVPAATARQVNSARAAGSRVVAVGTTVTRALESAAGTDGEVRSASGWTDLVLGPQHPVQVVTGLITGLHNPDASHLLLVESVAGAELAQLAYDAAVTERYLWHEFGDSCLLLRR